MKLLLDTSMSTCRVMIVDDHGTRRDYEWEAGRSLAKDLLAYLRDTLDRESATFADLDGLAVRRGPGSFTGLRIGITVMNTLASSLAIPIVGTEGDEWHAQALALLAAGTDHQLVLPAYGSEANITTPRK